MMKRLRLPATVIALCLVSLAQAEIYKCEINGVKTFSYSGCPNSLRKDGDKWIDVDRERAEKNLWDLRGNYLYAKAQIEGRCDIYAKEGLK